MTAGHWKPSKNTSCDSQEEPDDDEDKPKKRAKPKASLLEEAEDRWQVENDRSGQLQKFGRHVFSLTWTSSPGRFSLISLCQVLCTLLLFFVPACLLLSFFLPSVYFLFCFPASLLLFFLALMLFCFLLLGYLLLSGLSSHLL